ILQQQVKKRHRYTGAEPGGWGWSHFSGSVPDCDDTAGALIAIANLGSDVHVWSQAKNGLQWMVDLQNANGGWPTFCRGWGRLPFDRSGSDLTAHALRAFSAWWTKKGFDLVSTIWDRFNPDGPRDARAVEYGRWYLLGAQQRDGSWSPLWFG